MKSTCCGSFHEISTSVIEHIIYKYETGKRTKNAQVQRQMNYLLSQKRHLQQVEALLEFFFVHFGRRDAGVRRCDVTSRDLSIEIKDMPDFCIR